MLDGSGNVFADIGVDQPEEAEAKAQIIDAIARLLDRQKITEQESGKLAHLNKQKKILLNVRGDTRKFSYERLSVCAC